MQGEVAAVRIETGEAPARSLLSDAAAWGLWVLVVLAACVVVAAAWGGARARWRERRAGDAAFGRLARRMGLSKREREAALEIARARGVAAAGVLLCPSLWPAAKAAGGAQAGRFSGRS